MKLFKCKDINETVFNLDILQFFNKKEYNISRITIKHEEETKKQYSITLVLNGESENLEIVLLYKNKKYRDLDYKKLISSIEQKEQVEYYYERS